MRTIELNLVNNNLPIPELKAILDDYVNSHTIENINLRNSIDVEAFDSLLKCISTNPIESLNLTGTLLTPKLFEKLFEVLKIIPTLKRVSLENTCLSRISEFSLCQFIAQTPSLQELNINNNNVNQTPAIKAALLLNKSGLQINFSKEIPSPTAPKRAKIR